jgi:TolA-binding protein
MSSKEEQVSIPQRWTGQTGGSEDEATAGALLRSVALQPPMGEKKLAEVHVRLRESLRKPSRVAVRPTTRLLRQLAFAAGFALFGGALSASMMHVILRAPQPGPEPAANDGNRKPARRQAGPRSHSAEAPLPTQATEALPGTPSPLLPPVAAPPTVPAAQPPATARPSISAHRLPAASRLLATREKPSLPSPTPTVAPVEAARPLPPPIAPAPRLAPPEQPGTAVSQPLGLPIPFPPAAPAAPTRTVAPPVATTPAAQPVAQLARESRLLASAIAQLRQHHDPEGALSILDRHRAEFGTGSLGPEANATRIEALLRLRRNAQALALLDAQALSAQGVDREMLVARAELRAQAGRHSEAVRDFGLLLSGSSTRDAISERALYGRATSRAKNGDWDGARRDFERYLTEFPQGRFLREARSALFPKGG